MYIGKDDIQYFIVYIYTICYYIVFINTICVSIIYIYSYNINV